MSEASHERDKQRDAEAKAKAYSQGRYQIIHVSDRRCGVIVSYAWCSAEGYEHATFNFVPGLDRLKCGDALNAALSLNRGDTKPEDYAPENK